MAPGQDDASPNDDVERERFRKKLDGHEAMGLEVDDLRRLLEEDIDEFKATYLGTIRTQLEGGSEEAPKEGEPEEPAEEIEVGEVPEEEADEEPKPAYVMEKEEAPEEVEEPSEELDIVKPGMFLYN